MSYGVRQFVMTDPGGNMIRIGQPIATEAERRAPASKTRLEKAFEAASLLLTRRRTRQWRRGSSTMPWTPHPMRLPR